MKKTIKRQTRLKRVPVRLTKKPETKLVSPSAKKTKLVPLGPTKLVGEKVALVGESIQLTGETIHLKDQPIKLTKKQKSNLVLKSDKSKEVQKRLVAAEEELGASRQPRFSKASRGRMFSSIMAWSKELEKNEPSISPTASYTRDRWLTEVIKKEPFLNSVLTSVISVDRNRGWNVLGGKRYVKRVTDILHEVRVAPDLKGWRSAMSIWSQSFHGTDLGALIEPEWALNKLYALYPVDPCMCRLTGRMDTPLEYLGSWGSNSKLWEPEWYRRVVDSPSYREESYGLGTCAVSRAIELAKIMIALWQHDKEKLLATAPKGILLLSGISEQQWDQTLQEHEDQMTALERKYYQGVQVLASDGLSGNIDARLMSLSELPEQLSQTEFTNLLMMFYALAFGYDPREFWPVNSGSWGTSLETQMQHEKATQKGGMDFILNFQESLQELLPHTVDFEFEQRDSAAEAAEQDLKSRIINNILMLTSPVGAEQTPLISRMQALNLLAAEDIIPQEWTAQEEMVMSEDTEDNPGQGNQPLLHELIKLIGQSQNIHLKSPEQIKLTPQKQDQLYLMGQQLKFLPAIERSLYYAPNEPIVKYRNKTGQYEVIPVPIPVQRFYSLGQVSE